MYVLRGPCLRFWLMLFVALVPLVASAELLQVLVPSDQRSEEAEVKAVEIGFREAVVQLSGDPAAADNEALMKQLGEPQQYLNSYYDQPAGEGKTGWVYVVEFEKDLLASRLPGAPVQESPAAKEPSALASGGTLVWMVVEQQVGDVFMLTQGYHSELASDLRQWFEGRGAAWVLPPDAAAGSAGVSMGAVLNRDVRVLQSVSSSLGLRQSVAVVLTELGPASWLARVTPVGSDAEDRLGDASSYSEALELALGPLAEDTPAKAEMEQQAVVATELTSVTIAVSNIQGYADFSRVANYLNSLSGVESWLPRGSQAGVALFEVALAGSHEAFLEAMTGADDSPFVSARDGVSSPEIHSAHYSFSLK